MQAAIEHEGKDDIWSSASIDTHSNEGHDIGVMEVSHLNTLFNDLAHYLFAEFTCQWKMLLCYVLKHAQKLPLSVFTATILVNPQSLVFSLALYTTPNSPETDTRVSIENMQYTHKPFPTHESRSMLE